MASGDRKTGHERIDYKFEFPLFDYDTPVKFQREYPYRCFHSYLERTPIVRDPKQNQVKTSKS